MSHRSRLRLNTPCIQRASLRATVETAEASLLIWLPAAADEDEEESPAEAVAAAMATVDGGTGVASELSMVCTSAGPDC
jgi:hypothetical protein